MARRKSPRPLGYHFDRKDPVARPDGLKPCRWCKGPVVPPKQCWCGNPDCVLQWTMRTQPRVFRQVVFDRDKGICALCGLDTRDYDLRRIEAQARLSKVWYEASKARRPRITPRPEMRPDGTPRPPEHWVALAGPALEWRMAHKLKPDDPPWQADHITPIVLGGDWFALSNVRTLCCPCHRRVTEELNARLRARRRPSGELHV
jgi:5-methylcytosine-specific restriction protein A